MTHVREELPVDLLIIIQVHVVPSVAEEHDQEDIVERVVRLLAFVPLFEV